MSRQDTILIVDDDHDTHQYLADLLRMFGYQAGCVHSSSAAEAVIRQEAPDFLILDLHIEQPYAGWMLLQRLRADPSTAAIPAVLATSDRDFVRDRTAEVQELGGEVLEKPFAPDNLLKIVERAIGTA